MSLLHGGVVRASVGQARSRAAAGLPRWPSLAL